MSNRRRTAIAAVALAACTLTACGSDGGSSTNTTAVADTVGERVLAGIVRDPAPAVDGTTLPSLTNEGTDVEFRGEPGGLKAVYFGYTNCPDVCPTTMSDWTVTLRRLPEEIASQVDTVMVTVDPERDND
ncbi:MAG TPA: SCO family protein, partial [Ilumatobacteraceae bacterium]|nr:SCO family protein [Ilumatobacteraceae bacterium]